MRRQYKSNELPYGPSVGDLINWSLLAADGVAPEVAAEETVISMTSDNAEVQDMVRRVVRMIFGGSSGSPPLAETKSENTNEYEKEVVAPSVTSRPVYRTPAGDAGTGGFSDSFDSDSGF